jgi:hypothetical protein
MMMGVAARWRERARHRARKRHDVPRVDSAPSGFEPGGAKKTTQKQLIDTKHTNIQYCVPLLDHKYIYDSDINIRVCILLCDMNRLFRALWRERR